MQIISSVRVCRDMQIISSVRVCRDMQINSSVRVCRDMPMACTSVEIISSVCVCIGHVHAVEIILVMTYINLSNPPSPQAYVCVPS